MTRLRLAQLGRRHAQLQRALRAAIAGKASSEELARLARIETLRAELERCSDEFVDFGALPSGGEDPVKPAAAGRRTIAEMCKTSSKPAVLAGLLFRLVREMRPDRRLELGTCLGISAAYQASALELNGRGFLVTLEGAPGLASRATDNLHWLGLAHRVELRQGPFNETLGSALDERGPFDFVFIDGHHEEEATLHYLEAILPHTSAGCVLVFDDIDWSPGMVRAWRRITEHPASARPWTSVRWDSVSTPPTAATARLLRPSVSSSRPSPGRWSDRGRH